jgi:predicted unusual protein kinase regulating ubiquinone biosynthesis (AarF/ABC1/UbiB family)
MGHRVAWRQSHRTIRLSRRSQLWRFYRVSRLLFITLWVMTRERNRVVRARAAGRYDVRPDVKALQFTLREFNDTAVRMGGLLIKLGQFLSSRADLLPQEALAELASLQDDVPPQPFSAIRRVLEAELRAPVESVFASIDPVPSGSASLGQVHRARLRDGREAAIKVQRPGISQIVRTDLATLRFVLGVIRRLLPAANEMMDLRGMYREFSRVIYEELDYHHEGHNAERFARLTADQWDVAVPKVYWDYTTRRVLALEWVEGIKITQLDQLDAAGVDRGLLARRLMNTYFKQILQLGFFHADPHPGNIFVQPRGDSFRMVFVDFGMMGTITPPIKRGLRDCFTGVVWRDTSLIVRGLADLGFLGPNARQDALEKSLEVLLDRFGYLPFGRIRDVDPYELMDEVQSVLYGQQLRLPAQFAFLGRAAAMLVGLTTTLSPDFNFIDVAEPFARSLTRGGSLEGMLHLLGVESAGQLGRVLTREGIAMARTISQLPHLAERVLTQVERGELRLVLQGPELNAKVRRHIAANALGRPVPAWVPLTLAGVITTMMIFRRRANGG